MIIMKVKALLVLLLAALCYHSGKSQNQLHVEGSRNIPVLCMDNINLCSGAFFWIIAGSVYGVLHLPKEFVLCSYYCHLHVMRVSVVTREMDGFTFQCASINYYTNTEQLGDTTEFTVVPSNGPTVNNSVSQDWLELDYTQSHIYNVNIAVTWKYSSLTCQHSFFTIEGFDVQDTDLTQSTPLFSINSSALALNLAASSLQQPTNGELYFRLLAYDRSGNRCVSESTRQYYKLDNSTEVTLYPASAGTACIPIPVELSSGRDYSSLEIVWPENSNNSSKLCHCPPYEGQHHLFSRCISSITCNTTYLIAVRNMSICFTQISQNLSGYFTLLDFCPNHRYSIRVPVTSFIIFVAPPLPPEISYTNQEVCFWNESFAIESFQVTLSDASGNTVFTRTYATPSCLNITGLYLCGYVTVSVFVTSGVGRSDATERTFFVGVCVESTANIVFFEYLFFTSICPEWTASNQAKKLQTVATELTEFIGQRCNCTFPSTLITRAHFTCPPSQPSPPHPQHVTYRASIAPTGQLNRSMLEAVLKEWPALHRAILLQGELLSVDHTCPVIISSFQEDEFMISVMPAVVVIMMVLVFIAMLSVCNLKYRRVIKKLKLQHESTRLESVNPALPLSVTSHNHVGTSGPQYEEIQELRVAKMASHSTNNTQGDSYEITKCPAYAAAGEL